VGPRKGFRLVRKFEKPSDAQNIKRERGEKKVAGRDTLKRTIGPFSFSEKMKEVS